ncbi:MAG TPA: hypothetical protein VHW92_07860 [Mycobacteriales bacterium]|jgi:hypothetical protein|nr:hypothetical protein [Mycobacteriales bacterium]
MSIFCFDNVAVTIEAIYFLDPDQRADNEGPERGVRIELHRVDRFPHQGSVYAAQPFVIGTAIWRADFLESVAAGPGSADRMHYHPLMADSEPGSRVFDTAIPADPIGWLSEQLSDLDALLLGKVDHPESFAADASALRNEVPHIAAAAATTLDRVRAGELAQEPASAG